MSVPRIKFQGTMALSSDRNVAIAMIRDLAESEKGLREMFDLGQDTELPQEIETSKLIDFILEQDPDFKNVLLFAHSLYFFNSFAMSTLEEVRGSEFEQRVKIPDASKIDDILSFYVFSRITEAIRGKWNEFVVFLTEAADTPTL